MKKMIEEREIGEGRRWSGKLGLGKGTPELGGGKMDAGAPLAGIVAEEESSRELELGTTTAAAQRERERERRGSMGTAAHDLGAAVVGESILDRWRLKFSAVSRHWWIDADGG
ncbi:hypothetical protein M0R45_027552 [Rubus argutus]|uniref:Uncharacterized protein n=1 Tax=Rubus argutus TaxID=59490 RepID=A0AAW1X0P6_RUBAR